MNNYTRNAWKGNNYDRDLDIKEIAKILRKKFKKEFPKTKFSIRIERYSMGQSMSINILESDVRILKDSLCQYQQVNQYYIKESDLWTDAGKDLLDKTFKMVSGYNYDDSDSQIDYFDTNFYVHMSVGCWDKPFICTDDPILLNIKMAGKRG